MKLFFDMQIVDETGRIHARLRREIQEDAAFIGSRTVPEMRAGFVKMDDAIQIMRVREFRRDLLKQAATLAGMALADHLEDREGWHGQDRQRHVEEQYSGG